ncbi:MAG: peptide chain release factor 1, partial [Thermoplasmata archaeon]|nr:peptide chain release factor 1 [Thermoplasmata archaeon]
QKVVQPLFDVGYTDEYGLRELVEKATQTLHGLELTEEKRVIQQLLSEIRRAEKGLAAYGEHDTAAALEAGAVETLLISEGLRRRRLTLRCAACGRESKKVVPDDAVEPTTNGPCPLCQSGPLSLTDNEDYVEGLFRRAQASGAAIRLISAESEEGEMLAKAFGGIAALLRYPMATRNPTARAPR